jgi:hypothetical protein
MLLPAMFVAIDGFGAVGGGLVVQRVSIVSCRIGWLSLTWAIRTFPVSLAASNVFLTVHGVGREDDAGQPEFADHLLRGGSGRRGLRPLSLLFSSIGVCAKPGRRLLRPRSPKTRRRRSRSAPPSRLAIQRLQHGAQRVHRRRPLQRHAEVLVEKVPALIQEGDDAPIGARAPLISARTVNNKRWGSG